MSSAIQFINNAANVPLNANSGTMPDASTALDDWMQIMTFGIITKVVSDFQVIETVVSTTFMGVWQPLTGRQLMMKPEGQRQWNYFSLHVYRGLNLKIDDVIIYLTKQYRVIAKKYYVLEQFQYYELVEDWISSGPPTP
jgi:hypothetical protein